MTQHDATVSTDPVMQALTRGLDPLLDGAHAALGADLASDAGMQALCASLLTLSAEDLLKAQQRAWEEAITRCLEALARPGSEVLLAMAEAAALTARPQITLAQHFNEHITATLLDPGGEEALVGSEAAPLGALSSPEAAPAARVVDAVALACAGHLISVATPAHGPRRAHGAGRGLPGAPNPLALGVSSAVMAGCPCCGAQLVKFANLNGVRVVGPARTGERPLDAVQMLSSAGPHPAWGSLALRTFDHPGQTAHTLRGQTKLLWAETVEAGEPMDCLKCGASGPALAFVVPWSDR